MKKLLILITLTIALCSCESNLPMQNLEPRSFFIESIETHYKNGCCKYNISTKNSYLRYMNELTIIDSIGKFDIGDTVYFILNKKK